MEEHKTLYWTHGRANRGIISLVKDGIVIFHSDSKLVLNKDKLRDIVYANINFRDIEDIGVQVTFLRGKMLFLVLDDKSFESIIGNIPEHLQDGMTINRKLKKLVFEVNVDSMEEILDFEQKASALMKGGKKKD